MLGNIYSLVDKWTAACLKDRLRLSIILACFFIIVLMFTALYILQDFPNSADEYDYIYQAKTFLNGRFWNPAHPLQDFFNIIWTINHEGKHFSQYPFGWPMVLAAGMLFNIPIVCVNPILAVASLFILFALARNAYNEKIALISVLTVFFTSFFLLNSASYFSHTLMSLEALIFVYYIFRFLDTGRFVFIILSGLFTGFGFLTRPYDTALCVIPALAILLFTERGICIEDRSRGAGRRWAQLLRILMGFSLGLLPSLLMHAVYNYNIMGSPFASAFYMNNITYDFRFSIEGLRITWMHIVDLALWAPTFFIALYPVYLARLRGKGVKSAVIASIFIFTVFGYYLFVNYGGNQYGPRYYFSAFPFLTLFIVSETFKKGSYGEMKRPERFYFFLFLIGFIINLAMIPYHFTIERRVIWERMDPYRLVKKKNVRNAIVFLKSGAGQLRYMVAMDMARNDIGFTNDVLYAYDRGPEENKRLESYYKGKECWFYYYDRASGVGSLKKAKKIK